MLYGCEMLMTGTAKRMKPASERPLRLSRISAVKRQGMDADASLIHGDVHAGNVFDVWRIRTPLS